MLQLLLLSAMVAYCIFVQLKKKDSQRVDEFGAGKLKPPMILYCVEFMF